MTTSTENPFQTSASLYGDRRTAKGFALISVLLLMVLLAAISVGLLTLSTITLRASSSETAQATARANARMAMMLALGELQKHAGPDSRITATASVLDEPQAQPHLTGVWNSRSVDPESPGDFSKDAKNRNFRGWLCSTIRAQQAADIAYAQTLPEDRVIPISREATGNPETEVSVARVPVQGSPNGSPNGSFAYAVFDEGVKARVNLGQSTPSGSLANQAHALRSGQRPGINRLSETGDTSPADFSLDQPEGRSRIAAMLSTRNAEIGHGVLSGTFSKYFHDLTAYSNGLMCNVVDGGLKSDLNLICEGDSPPPALAGKSVYQNAYDIEVPSDLSWDRLAKSLNIYRGEIDGEPYLSSSNGLPVLRASAPSDWSAGTAVVSGPATPNPKAPSGPVLMPSIAKVQMIFSLAARDIYRYPKDEPIPEDAEYLHSPWAPFFQDPFSEDQPNNPSAKLGTRIDTDYDFLLHLITTPVITLHNPYNVFIEFTDLRVEFLDLPFSLQVFRNGEAQSSDLVPVSGMFGGGGSFGQSKRFGLNLGGKDASGAPDGSAVRLAPGEVRVFSPYIPASRTWAQEIAEPLWFVDWANNNAEDGRTWTNLDVDTSRIKAVSGWRGDGIGFDIDSFAPGRYNVRNYEIGDEINPNTGEPYKYQRDQCIGLREQDEIHLEFAPIPDPDRNTTRFTVEMTLVGANPTAEARTSVIEFEYESNDGLKNELLGSADTIRYPETGTVNTMDIFDHSAVPVGSTSNTRPFALFSAYAKTTYGGFNDSKEDGSYASKPWSFHNHSALTASQNIVQEHPAHHSHEISLVRLPGNTDQMMSIQPGTDRGHFITGHRALTGRRLGVIHDIPLGPPQSLTDLNVALPAATYHLPRFTRPIGNSFAHPLLSSNAVVENGPTGYKYADHSFLLNSVLYDGYYLSGFQGREGAFGDGMSASELATGFLTGATRLSDTRFTPYFPDGKTPEDGATELMEADGFKKAAAYQLLKGAFNVNSTSVEAWMAVLSSMSGDGAKILSVPQGSGTESIEDLAAATDAKGARFSRFSLPNAQPDSSSHETYWQAPRDITHEQLEELATEIVAQVRARGPFLSMSDFVNRQPGPAGEASLSGALQAAIDKTDINNNSGLGGFEITTTDVANENPAEANQELTNIDAAIGPSAQGAPGYLTQEDLLAVLGNAACVRSDTFIIRSYGDARDSNDRVIAKAWCEAVVQRVPEYVDPADPASTAPADLTSEANRTFGRRFKVVSFRWLNPLEI